MLQSISFRKKNIKIRNTTFLLEKLCQLLQINRRKFYKHVLIGKQFIKNDDPINKTQIDHINRDKTDNHINNLRWVSNTENQYNLGSKKGIHYEYVDEIPDESIVVDTYGAHKFENYYYHDNVFYFYNGIQYRKLHIIEYKNGSKCVHMTDSNGENIGVYYNKFKKQYDLL